MPNYKYTAKNAKGRTVHGALRAASEDDLYAQLRAQELYLMSCKDSSQAVKSGGKLKIPVVADFCQQLGTLLSAGVTLVRALNIIGAEEGLPPKRRAMYERMQAQIRQGNTLSDAMELEGNAFPPLLVNMIRASEGSGGMDKAALRMAKHYEKDDKMTQKAKTAMVYPIVVLVVGVIVVGIIMGFVMPQFSEMFDQMGTLPLATRLLMSISGFVSKQWLWLIIGVIVLIFLLKLLATMPPVRMKLDRAKLHLPVVGKLNSKICTARLASTISTLYASGMPMITVLQVARTTVGNLHVSAQFDKVIEQVRAGELLSKSLEEVDGLQKKLASSIRVGEETGSLDHMLNVISESMEYEAEMATQKLVTLLEPAMLIVLALVVGFVIMAVILPIFQSYSIYSNDISM